MLDLMSYFIFFLISILNILMFCNILMKYYGKWSEYGFICILRYWLWVILAWSFENIKYKNWILEILENFLKVLFLKEVWKKDGVVEKICMGFGVSDIWFWVLV